MTPRGSRRLLTAYAGVFFLFLYAPIAVLVVLSFNDSQVMGFPFRGFSVRWYGEVFAGGALAKSLFNSFAVGLTAAFIATAIALMAALGLRHDFPGRSLVIPAMLVPIITPGIVSGVVLLVFFGVTGIPYGLWTGALVAHITWVLPFAFLTLYPRLHKFDRALEEAAMDLGANPFTTFARVTLPLIAPGIAAGALLAFALSVDDFVITLFNAGSTITFPLYVWGAARVGVPPQVNVIGTLIFLAAAGLMLVNVLFQNRREREAT